MKNAKQIIQDKDPMSREYPIQQMDTVDVKINSSRPSFELSDFPELADSIITGLYIPKRDELGNARAISTGQSLINDAALQTGYITLQTIDGIRVIDRVPLSFFTDDTLGTQPFQQLWIVRNLNPSQCFVEFANNGSQLQDNETLQLIWVFVDPENC